MLYGIVTTAFHIYTNKMVLIEEGTKVCMECVDGLTGGWSVASAEHVWYMNSDRMRRVIKTIQ